MLRVCQRGLSSRESERFDYVAREVVGYCSDVGCGKNNRFVNDYLNANDAGVSPYDGLAGENIVEITYLSLADASFVPVTFAASIGQIPESIRGFELAEPTGVGGQEGHG